MSNPIWPTDLPSPSATGWEERLGANVIRAKTDAGPAKVRRRSTATVDILSVQLLCTTAQREAFRTFYRVTTADGSLAFDWQDPILGTNRTCRFAEGEPVMRPNGAHWLVTFQLERLP